MLSFRPSAGRPALPIWLALGLSAATWIAAAETPDAGGSAGTVHDYERIYRIELGGQPAGWVVESGSANGDHLVTDTSTRMEVSRAGTLAAMEMSSRFVETRDHRPVSATVRQTLGARPLVTRYLFDDEGVEVVEAEGARRRRPSPDEPWMTPVEAAEHLAEQVRTAQGRAVDGEVAIEIRRLEPLVGLEPITGRYVLQEAHDPVRIDGALVAAGRWAASESYAPLVTTLLWLDADGVLLRSEAQMMGTTMVTVLTEKDPRAEPPAAGPGELPEMLVQTFIVPAGRIEAPRRVRRATYRLRADGLDLSTHQGLSTQQGDTLLPSGGIQTVRPDGDALLVTVDLTAELPTEHLADRERYLNAGRYLDHDSPAVAELLAAWREGDDGGELAPADRAESLRRLVTVHLDDKNLGTVLGTASEAARQRAGDCTEHAVLLAALLRAEGIPSRVAVGLVYAESFAGRSDIFAYHMWTQAYLGAFLDDETGELDAAGRWVDLDATLDPGTPFDATHLLFATSDFGEEGVPLLGTGVEAVFGRLEIEVVETDSVRSSR